MQRAHNWIPAHLSGLRVIALAGAPLLAACLALNYDHTSPAGEGGTPGGGQSEDGSADGRSHSSTLIVAASDNNAVHTSADQGSTWTSFTPGAGDEASWENVAHHAGTWLLGSWSSPRIARSTDAENWVVTQPDGWNADLDNVKYAGVDAVNYEQGAWWIGRNDGLIAASRDDGLTFEELGRIADWKGAVEHFSSQGNVLFAVGDGGQVARSTTPHELASWERTVFSDAPLKAVASSASLTLAVGKGDCPYTVNAGDSWSSCGLQENLYDVKYSCGEWFVTADTTLYRSKTGHSDWQSIQVPFSATSVVYDCGTKRLIVTSWKTGIHLSDDQGQNWQPALDTSVNLEFITGN